MYSFLINNLILIVKFIFKYKFLFLLLFTLTFVTFSVKKCNYNKERIEVLENNQDVLYSKIKTYKNKNNKSITEIRRLELSVSEFKKYEQSLVNTLKSMEVKLKNANSVLSLNSQSNYKIKTILKDSIIYNFKDSLIVKRDTIKCFSYKDKWIEQNGCIVKDSFIGNFNIKDTIDCVVYKVPKKFLCFEYGIKRIELKVSNRNPYSNIINGKYIELKKYKKE